MTETTPAEASWDTAPNLLDGAMNLTLTPQDCNLRYWLQSVPLGTLRGRVDGYTPGLPIPEYMRKPGPLYDAITKEYAFRAMAEEKAARVLAYLVPVAPDIDSMEFYVTQVLDEARHAMVFRGHLVELGVPQVHLVDAMEEFAGADRRTILDPLEDFALDVMRDKRDFLGGVIVLTVIIEGALAPAAELSERKWRMLDPAASEIDRGAAIDEIRHLTVGAAVGRQHLIDHPEDKPRVLAIIRDGMRLWEELPIPDLLQRREQLFQQGMAQ
ncbi:MAG: VlmB-like protein, partial [Pseudonocardiales bacterium]|nr:VlmB-like protein [Pseudonocardiales bacterium]